MLDALDDSTRLYDVAGGSMRHAPDPRTIGTALVSLLSDLTAEAPVLVAVDDVQWLDRPGARALEFAVRRLEDHAVVVLATLRVEEASADVGLLSALSPERVRRTRLGPIGTGALYEIVRDTLGQALTRPLLGRIGRASGGNPFYALEIARAWRRRTLRPPGWRCRLPRTCESLCRGGLRRLPASTRSELFELSALGRPTIERVDEAALEPAVVAGVVSVRADGRVEFSHPLFAGAVYERASGGRRRELHRELAERVADPEERARHLALAAGHFHPSSTASISRRPQSHQIADDNIAGNICGGPFCGPDPIEQAQGPGIAIESAFPGTTVTDDRITSNDVGVYQVASPDCCEIADNVLTNNRFFGIVIQDGDGTRAVTRSAAGRSASVWWPTRWTRPGSCAATGSRERAQHRCARSSAPAGLRPRRL